MTKKETTIKTVRAFAIELAIYAVLVVAYFFLVLHLLGGWLYQLEGLRRHAKTRDKGVVEPVVNIAYAGHGCSPVFA